jgi:Ca2+-binding EF-hand superfamily protein
MKKKILLITTAAALLAATGVYAAGKNMAGKNDTDGNGTISKSESRARAGKNFDEMDANRDGKLDGADRDARQRKHFDMMDKDHNGSINWPEFAEAHNGMESGRGGAMSGDGMMQHEKEDGDHDGERGGKMMTMMDGNGDKAISRDEFLASSEKRFDKVDADDDGNLTTVERKSARKDMRQKRLENRKKRKAG